MKYIKILIATLALSLVLPVCSQKRKAQIKKKTPAPVVVVEEPSKFDEMLGNTQHIIFIDSVVVDKKLFLNAYQLGNEAGIIDAYNSFFNATDQPYSTVYINELGNKCWFAKSGRLYTSDLLESQWSTPTALKGLGRFQRTNYPFMLSDGNTLFFSAISDEGLGGLDIYVSRYDAETSSYLLAENIGLPFNSDANDYMYAVDELNNIGYFATDRRQPDGKVCIYTFIPNQKRVTYDVTMFDSKEELIKRAKLERISDTWGNGTEREKALHRLESIKKSKNEKKAKQDFTFIINDDVIYTHYTDFRDKKNRERMKTLLQLRQQFEKADRELEDARLNYACLTSKRDRSKAEEELKIQEHDYYQLEQDIKQLEKSIRNSENKTK